jgi:hypothetical protein
VAGRSGQVIAEALVEHPAWVGQCRIIMPANETYASNGIRVNDDVLSAVPYPGSARPCAFRPA